MASRASAYRSKPARYRLAFHFGALISPVSTPVLRQTRERENCKRFIDQAQNGEALDREQAF